MKKNDNISKGDFLTHLDYEYESHSYNDNQFQIKFAVELMKNEVYRF